MSSIIIVAATESPTQVNPIAALTSIQESFFTRSFNFEAVSEWLWGVGGIALLLLVYIVVKAIKARRNRYNPFGTINDPRAIRSILHSAFDQRRPFEIQFHTDARQRRPTLRCAPEYLGRDSMTVEVNGLQTLSDKWLGLPVTVFFRILLGREFTYYTFSSRIDGIHLPRQGICQLTLPLPGALENRQKRSFLRITPPKEFLLGSAMWHGETMPQDNALIEITSWPRPQLLFIPERVEQFHLLDISAGGARISIPNTVLRSLDLQFAASEHLLLMLDLLDPKQNKRLRFWMQCRVQNAWMEHATRNLHMGVQFLSWARPKETPDHTGDGNAAGIEWLRLSSSHEVELLGNWIMRRHLELFRENPFEE